MLRVNLSESGIGLSFGVKGLRVGTGPHGNYIHAGRKGVYYRKSLPQLSNEKEILHLSCPIILILGIIITGAYFYFIKDVTSLNEILK